MHFMPKYVDFNLILTKKYFWNLGKPTEFQNIFIMHENFSCTHMMGYCMINKHNIMKINKIKNIIFGSRNKAFYY